MHHLERRRHGRRRLEGPRAGDELVEEHADGEEIAPPVERRLAGGLLRREIIRRPEDHAGARTRAGLAAIEHLGDAEIEQAHHRRIPREVDREEHVLRLQIAVDDPRPVRRVQRLQHGQGRAHRGLDIEARDARQRRADRLPVEQLHHDVRPELAHPRVEHVDHVGVADAVDGLRLLKKTLRELDAQRKLRVEELDRHRPPRVDVLGAEYIAHPAAADPLGEAIFVVDERAGAGRPR